MPQDPVPRRYSPQEVKSILGRALKEDPQALVGADELRETAAELGVSQEALTRAMEEHEGSTALERARLEYVQMRRQRLARQAATWFGVNLGMGILDFLPDGTQDWAQYPAAVWGVMVLFSAARTWFMTSEDVDQGAHKLLAQREKRALYDNFRKATKKLLGRL